MKTECTSSAVIAKKFIVKIEKIKIRRRRTVEAKEWLP